MKTKWSGYRRAASDRAFSSDELQRLVLECLADIGEMLEKNTPPPPMLVNVSNLSQGDVELLREKLSNHLGKYHQDWCNVYSRESTSRTCNCGVGV